MTLTSRRHGLVGALRRGRLRVAVAVAVARGPWSSHHLLLRRRALMGSGGASVTPISSETPRYPHTREGTPTRNQGPDHVFPQRLTPRWGCRPAAF